jgi:hypothetical protein
MAQKVLVVSTGGGRRKLAEETIKPGLDELGLESEHVHFSADPLYRGDRQDYDSVLQDGMDTLGTALRRRASGLLIVDAPKPDLGSNPALSRIGHAIPLHVSSVVLAREMGVPSFLYDGRGGPLQSLDQDLQTALSVEAAQFRAFGAISLGTDLRQMVPHLN